MEVNLRLVGIAFRRHCLAITNVEAYVGTVT